MTETGLSSYIECFSKRVVIRPPTILMCFFVTLSARGASATWQPCSGERMASDGPGRDYRHNNGYLSLSLRGGFNQQRKGILNAVVLAKILNATLVIPILEEHERWNISL